jgi:Holliday junction resolvase
VSSGGKASRAKGDRLERAIVRLLQDRGIGAERVPLSGSAGGRYSGDISVPCLGRDLVIEAKSRGSGFRQLYKWLDGRDALVLRADRCEPIVVLRLNLAAEIVFAAEGTKVCSGVLMR